MERREKKRRGEEKRGEGKDSCGCTASGERGDVYTCMYTILYTHHGYTHHGYTHNHVMYVQLTKLCTDIYIRTTQASCP